MYKPVYAPWENGPKKLTHQEAMNPLSVIRDFFDIDLVDGHLDKLRKWRRYVTRNKCYKDKTSGVEKVLFVYDANIRLLEAVFIKYYEVINKGTNRCTYSDIQLKNEKTVLDWYPENLSTKELRNPYQVVRQIFKHLSLQHYRDYLHEWLYLALAVKYVENDMSHEEIKQVFKNMKRLYSAAWLIHCRETNTSA